MKKCDNRTNAAFALQPFDERRRWWHHSLLGVVWRRDEKRAFWWGVGLLPLGVPGRQFGTDASHEFVEVGGIRSIGHGRLRLQSGGRLGSPQLGGGRICHIVQDSRNIF